MLRSPLLSRLGGYWDGAFQDCDSSAQFEVLDPATGQVLANLAFMGRKETRLALDSASLSLQTALPLVERVRILRDIAGVLLEHQEHLAQIITAENGKPLTEARGEVAYAAGFYSDAAERVPHLAPKAVAGNPRGFSWRVHHRAAGVAALITPWNFPLAMLAKKLSGALAGGCPSVVKPSEKTPLTCVAFFHLLNGLNLPKGLVNLVFGDAPAIGEVFCQHPKVRTLSFTGSTRVGRLLAGKCAPHFKRLSLELGGNAPFVLFEDADLPLAVEHLMANKFRCGGQTCVCSNRILVHETVASAFVEQVVTRVKTLRVGPGCGDNDLGPLIDEQGFDKVYEHVEDALNKGAKALLGGLPNRADAGLFFPPTVLINVSEDMLCTQEETFGPVIAISTFSDEKDALLKANNTPYGLAAYIFTANQQRAESIAGQLHFGHVGLNTATGPIPQAPFGGMLASGLGREGGLEGILEYVEMQTCPMGEFDDIADS